MRRRRKQLKAISNSQPGEEGLQQLADPAALHRPTKDASSNKPKPSMTKATQMMATAAVGSKIRWVAALAEVTQTT